MNDDIDKERLKECIQKMQILQFKGKSSDDIMRAMKDEGFTNAEITFSVEILSKMHTDSTSPIQERMSKISACMDKFNDEIQACNTVEQFYELLEKNYLNVFMQDKDIRGIPITFLYNEKKNPTIGIVPMNNTSDHSPMDDLKTVVYSTNPDAYIFCGEASYVSKDVDDDFKPTKYGDIQNDPNAKDCVVMVGNDRCGQHEFLKSYKINEVDDRLEFEDITFEGDWSSDKVA